MESFVHEYETALYNTDVHSFKDILTKLGVYYVKLTTGELLTAKINKLAADWLSLICPNPDVKSEFYKISKKLVFMYTNLLSDYIVGKDVSLNDINECVNIYVRFYELLSVQEHADVKQLWANYTKSILIMKNEFKKNGRSYNFKVYAHNIIVAGELLGTKLDYLMFYNKYH